MRTGSIRRVALVAILVIDFGLLATVTFYLFHGSEQTAAQGSIPTSQPLLANATQPAAGAARASPMAQATVEGFAAIHGSPRYIVCGAADHQGGAWLGTEGQGIWSFAHHLLQQFSIAQGLPEDGVCAVACDSLGRIWAGHEAHGVSIYNGHEWRNFDRFNGPGGSHVFAIATSPVDGDVWIGTENGLARYSLKNDLWTHFDRATGLPAAEVQAIAFDHEGDIVVALPDAGIACAKPADQFSRWTVVTGSDDVPTARDGPGLPGPIVNALLCTRDDVLYAGTTRGLARSTDHGASWSYIQGANWLQLVRGSYSSASTQKQTPVQSTSPLMEDWVTALAEDDSGALWVTYRGAGYQVFSGENSYPVRVLKGKLSVVVPLPNQSAVLGSVGDGALLVGSGDGSAALPPPPSFASALTGEQFPSGPKPVAADTLDALRKQIEALGPASDGVEYLSDDWETIGDWPGRYGTTAAYIMDREPQRETDGCTISLSTGPYRRAAMRYYETASQKIASPERGLVDPMNRKRTFWEHNDESYSLSDHPLWEEGPDLFVRVEVPGGVHRVSLYFCNYEGHSGFQEWREFPLQVRRTDAAPSAAVTDVTEDPILEAKTSNGSRSWLSPSDTVDAELANILCRSYVPRYWYGVYKQFLVRGRGVYWFKVVRNYANCCKINGLFVDRLDIPTPAVTDTGPAWPTPPAVRAPTNANATLDAAVQLWAALDAAAGRSGYAAVNAEDRTLAYQAAAANGAESSLLSNWRWTMKSWSKLDRDIFNNTYVHGVAH